MYCLELSLQFMFFSRSTMDLRGQLYTVKRGQSPSRPSEVRVDVLSFRSHRIISSFIQIRNLIGGDSLKGTHGLFP
jgi:hypothetical protein